MHQTHTDCVCVFWLVLFLFFLYIYFYSKYALSPEDNATCICKTLFSPYILPDTLSYISHTMNLINIDPDHSSYPHGLFTTHILPVQVHVVPLILTSFPIQGSTLKSSVSATISPRSVTKYTRTRTFGNISCVIWSFKGNCHKLGWSSSANSKSLSMSVLKSEKEWYRTVR